MDENVIEILKSGGVGVIPTDTIYGLVGSALKKKTVERMYALRKRNRKKPMIVLVGAVRDLARFGVRIKASDLKILKKYWPGKVSVILPCRSKKFAYLHRGTQSIAFRFPAKKSLMQMLLKTGPLVAPSANLEGKPPAKTIREAKKYFGEHVDFYLDAGRMMGKSSKLIVVKDGAVEVLRK